MQTIQVTGDRETELVAYAVLFRIFKAVDEAKAKHGPNAKIRFQLVAGNASKDAADTATLPAVRLVGDGLDLDIAIADDKTFDLPLEAAYLEKHPKLLISQKRYAKSINILISTPGIPAHLLRLGDLRLVCVATQQLALETAGWMSRLAINLMGLNACKARMNAQPDGAAPRINDGPKGADLAQAESRFIIPVADTTWSSDARIQTHPASARTP